MVFLKLIIEPSVTWNRVCAETFPKRAITSTSVIFSSSSRVKAIPSPSGRGFQDPGLCYRISWTRFGLSRSWITYCHICFVFIPILINNPMLLMNSCWNGFQSFSCVWSGISPLLADGHRTRQSRAFSTRPEILKLRHQLLMEFRWYNCPSPVLWRVFKSKDLI